MESQKKRKDLSLKEKIAILEQYDELPKTSQRKAALLLKISQPLLCKMLKNRDELEKRAELNENAECKRSRCGKDEQVEKALKRWFTNVREQDASVSGPLMRRKAEQLAAKFGKNDFVATNGWFSRWKKRENIAYSRTQGEQKNDVPGAETWIKEQWPKLLSSYLPENVYNADETALYFRALPEHSSLFKNAGMKGYKSFKERVTVLCCVSMTGVKRKLLVIAKSQAPSYFKNVKRLPVDYNENKTAWMTVHIFNDWLLKWDKELTHDILLLIDNCTAHIINVSLKHIKVVFLPSNTTSLIQPCDLGIVQALKAHYRLEMRVRILELMKDTEQFGPHDLTKTTSLLEALHLLTVSWNRVSPITIRKCFALGGFAEDKVLEDSAYEINVPTDMNIEDFEEWMAVDENIPIAAPLTEFDICHSACESNKEAKDENDSEGDECETSNLAEKPPTSADMRDALRILRLGVHHLSTDFQMQYEYDNFVNELLRKNCEPTKISEFFLEL